MHNLLITYDLNTLGQDYPALTEKIQSLGRARRILKSVWVLKTAQDAESVRTAFQAVIDGNDFVFVCRFEEWSAFMSEESNSFIQQA